MKSDFILAVTQLAAERKLPKDRILRVLEDTLLSVYKKDENIARQDVFLRISPDEGTVKLFSRRKVVEEVRDPLREVSLEEALKVNPHAKIGDIIDVEIPPTNTGRIAAQTAKQIMLQRLSEAEKEYIYEEFAPKEGELVGGAIQRIEPKYIIVDLGKAEGILPPAEQVQTERYRVGQRFRFYLLEVSKTPKGPQIILSRTHPNLVRRLFELEIPEVREGAVEIKALARDAGYRTKVAVVSHREGVDPLGACIGLRGIRIQNIINELRGEKVDLVLWHPDPRQFIANALSPVQVLDMELNEKEKTALVIISDAHYPLAIGKDGKNVRLAAKLTGWRIDIKSLSAVRERRSVHYVEKPEAPPEEAAPQEPAPPEAEEKEEARAEAPPEEAPATPEEVEEKPKPQIRFAEDIFAGRMPPALKSEKEKRKAKKRPKPLREEEEFDFEGEAF